MWTEQARQAAIAARQAAAKGRQQGGSAGLHSRGIVSLPPRRMNAGLSTTRKVAGAALGAMLGAVSAIVKPAISSGGMGGGGMRGRRGR
jgi:hypothetical protein